MNQTKWVTEGWLGSRGRKRERMGWMDAGGRERERQAIFGRANAKSFLQRVT